MKDFENEGRFSVIKKFKSHIKVYSAISCLALIFLITHTSFQFILFLIPVGLISILYTLPIFPNKFRLRDFNFIKIFLIAFVWAYLGIWIFKDQPRPFDFFIISIIFLERFLYIVAVTLPFDIRDLKVDLSINVKTIATRLGLNKTHQLINLLFIILIILWFIIIEHLQFLSVATAIFVTTSILLTWIAIQFSKNKKNDYYFSGLLDGVIILRSIIIIWAFNGV